VVTEHADWTVLVPLKRLADAKSRLELPAVRRQQVAADMACAMLAACRAARRVRRIVVVLQDAADAHRFAALVDEVRLEGIPSLNLAIRRGETAVRRREQHGDLAVLPGDLPFVTSVEVDHALALAAGQPRSFVPDRRGTGTSLLATTAGVPLNPAYGPDSARRHRSSGAVVLPVAMGSGLRHDVDVLADLRARDAVGSLRVG